MRTAIAYVTDTLLCPAKGVSRREEQKERLRAYAAEHGIIIAAWFEDEMCVPDPLERSGVRELLNYREACDVVLIDHPWCLSREWAKTKRVAEALVCKGRVLEAAQTGWDGCSQMLRHFFDPDRWRPAAPKRPKIEKDRNVPVAAYQPHA